MVSSFFPEWRRKNLIACPKWVRCGDPTLNRSNSSLALKLAMVLATVFWALGLHTAVQYDLKNFVALGLPCVRKPTLEVSVSGENHWTVHGRIPKALPRCLGQTTWPSFPCGEQRSTARAFRGSEQRKRT